MITLQNFILPTDPAFGSKEKYLRNEGNIYFGEGVLEVLKFSTVTFDTFYNAFSIPAWQKKVGIKNLLLQISGHGSVDIELWQITKKNVREYKDKVSIILSEERQTAFNLQINDEFAYTGLIFPKIIALQDAEITDIQWLTSDEPLREVKLGISITHFNRKAYVVPAITRIKENLLDMPQWQDKIDFVVVDNSKNITVEEAQGVTIIPNENTGGSGGFTRGFLHYKNETNATHVLFMDDDASLEVESIKRAYAILQFAKNEKSCVGAELFYEDRPDVLIERGSKLDKKITWRPCWHDSWIIPTPTLLEQELDEEKIEYAAWWFCAFPIKEITHLTLPYFVRGDDVSFGPLNDLEPIFVNGIACMAEDFAYKMAPMTEYLDLRNNLIVHTLFINSAFWATQHYMLQAFRFLFAIRYGYVDVLRMALKDYLHLTPEWLVENADMQKIIPKIKEMAKDNLPHEISLEDYDLIRPKEKLSGEGKVSHFFRRLTFNKSLFFVKNEKVIFQELTFMPDYSQISDYKKILYYNPQSKKGFVVETHRGKLFKNIFLIVGDGIRLFFSYRRMRTKLIENKTYLTSEEVWNRVLDIGGDR